jgi:hypothetical protein
MANIDKVSEAVAEWGFNVASAILPNVTISPNSTIGMIMQSVLHINPLNYSVWNELGFLVQPMLKTVITPTLNRYLSGMTDEQVKDMAMQFADAFVEQARTKGSVNLFGLDVGPKSFEGLKTILTAKLGQSR